MGKYILPILMFAALAGCATTTPISRDLQRESRPITMAQVKADPGGMRGTVIWGGRIVSTVNSTNGGAIYIMYQPLDETDKPLRYEQATGRFVAISRDFLDPNAFPRGRLITIAGNIAGVRIERLQNVQYTYPVINILQTHVWPVLASEQHNNYGAPIWWNQGPSAGYHDNLYNPNY